MFANDARVMEDNSFYEKENSFSLILVKNRKFTCTILHKQNIKSSRSEG